MQMLVQIGGAGIGAHGVKVSVGTTALIFFRNAPDEGSYGLEIRDNFSFGGSGPNFAVSTVRTQWFTVNASKHSWLHEIPKLVGRRAELIVTGSTALNDGSTVDIKWTIAGPKHGKAHELELIQVPVQGSSFQFGSTSIEGKMKASDPDEHLTDVGYAPEKGLGSVQSGKPN